MIILGLTGGMGMGKSTVARMFRLCGVPVFDADRTVHALQSKGGEAVAPIAALLRGAVKDGAVDRKALKIEITRNPFFLAQLEKIIHPLVAKKRRFFLEQMHRQRRKICLLDIPLLFESRAHRLCDKVIVVNAPPSLQKQRIAHRRSMNDAEIRKLLARQLPNRERLRRADYIIHTGGSKGVTFQEVKHILNKIYKIIREKT